jgi:hypothetical protein
MLHSVGGEGNNQQEQKNAPHLLSDDIYFVPLRVFLSCVNNKYG